MKREITVEELFSAREGSLCLELLTPDTSLDRPIMDPDVSSPGLALAGYTERFPEGRMQVFGETEMTYLRTLAPGQVQDRLEEVFRHHIPAVFVSKSQEVPESLLALASDAGIPVFRSALGTGEFFRRIKPFLESALAPSTSLHGSLADVYGVGLLFVGRSGIGKSECVLDLVERGHRLVADDLVLVTRRGNDVLIGRGHELQRHHMEIRGIGIIDIPALFGIRSIRQQKRIEVVVQLETWDDAREYDRTGLDHDETEILGVTLPKVTIPLNPGKNITVICEVVAMNHLVKYAGVDPAAVFDRRLKQGMTPVREYLEQDFE
ncbi:MAG: HPr(Ser) kinase/phosphatase [Gemmatimonadetes bacterium]|nr:HPr(Ser) kinase/phosphatase [Gemmatimonadota bacterium]NIR77045.1 HPr(Ser) kinase/phosphatase [Gemmatimonadota bacterium]NIT88490.1 HPr(Ser) kinase/phosphatase [Gemmatimonadota bacterium]NIU32313.1 HPr(Ser) kinase/phosphatase [Gemmatimonadota bacterium]NIU34460.1 HPr(Ser) kinase/phosphatase [Gemmatimonadota bacterium]